MGNPFDQFDRQAAGTNPFDKFDDPVPEQEQGGFVPAFKRTIGNMASTAGVTGEDVLGKNSITSGLQEWGKGVEEANKPGITSLSDIPKKPGTYVTESLANMGAQLAPQGIAGVAGRVIGGLAGGRLGGRPGALAGQEIGGRIAQAIPTFVQEYGGIRQEQNDSADPKDVNKLRAVAAAIPATAIEFAFGPQKLLARFLDGATREQIKELAKQPTKEIIKGLGKEFVKGGLGEASEEYPQKMLEKWGANKDPLSKEAQNEALFSAAMAIPGGGIMQGGMSAYETAKAARQNAAEQQSVPPAPPTNPLLAQATQEFSPQPGSTSQLDQTPTSFDVPKTLPPSGPMSGAVNVGIASGATSLEPVLRERDFVPPPSGSYGQLAEFENLLNGERADKQSRVSDLLSGQAVQAASEAESQQARVDAAQAQQSAQERYNLLQQVAETLPDGRNLKRAFGRALKEAGYSNLDFTPEEISSIDNFNQINRSAGIAANIGPDIEPSTPNELDASQFIKEKGAKPEPNRHASNLKNRIYELELQIEQYGMTPERESEIVGLISQLDAQVAAKKKGIAAPTQTYGAQPTRTTPLLQTATNLGLPDVAQTDKTVKTETKREKEKPAPAIEQPTLPPESSANPAVTPQQAQKGPGLSTPIKSYAKKTAMSVASMMTRNGSPTEAYPHPSGDGTYALRVPGSGSEETPKETAPNSQAIPDRSTPQDAVGVNPNSSATLTSSPEAATAQEASPAPAQQTRSNVAPIMRRNDLVGAIMRVTGGNGIASSMSETLIGEKANRVGNLRGLFTNRGQQDMGDIAMLLREEEGFDVKDGPSLEELIREAASGNVAKSMAAQEEEKEINAEKEHRQNIRDEAARLGIKSAFKKFDILEREVLARQAEEAQAAQSEAEAERAAIQHESDVKELSDDQVNELLQLAADDGRMIGDELVTNEEVLAGFDATATIGEREDEAGASLNGEDSAREAARNSQEGSGQARAEVAPALTLEGQTLSEVNAQEKKRQADEAAAQRDDAPKGPNVTADQVDLFNTQGGLFNSNRDSQEEKAQKPEQPTAQQPESKEAPKQESKPEPIPPANDAIYAAIPPAFIGRTTVTVQHLVNGSLKPVEMNAKDAIKEADQEIEGFQALLDCIRSAA